MAATAKMVDMGMSESLRALEGRISDVEFGAKADIETAIVLQRYLLNRLGAQTAPTGD